MNKALIKTSNTTQAGIYQRLQQDSVAILVDELEAKDDTRTVDKILELARIAYSGDKMQRGGKDGVGARSFRWPARASWAPRSASRRPTPRTTAGWSVVNLRKREVAGGKLTGRPQHRVDAIGRDLLPGASSPGGRTGMRWSMCSGAMMIAEGHTDRAWATPSPRWRPAVTWRSAMRCPSPGDGSTQWREWLKPSELAETAQPARRPGSGASGTCC